MSDRDNITLPRELVERARKALTPMAYHTPPYERSEIAAAFRDALAAPEPVLPEVISFPESAQLEILEQIRKEVQP